MRVSGRPILGWVTLGSPQPSTPTLFVSARAVREFVSRADYRGRALDQRPSSLLERLTARAIGRVIAHELGHYLLEQRAHTAKGLMRSTYSPQDLIGPSLRPFQVSPADALVLRREVARLSHADAREK
jgi:hypothetical protein